jgi:GNAT superfamily N-acetyltransferase
VDNQTTPIKLRRLDLGQAASFAALRSVVMGAPHYARAYDGRAPGDDDVKELIASLPPGCAASQKELLVIDGHLGGAPIGCLSLVRGWPAADTVHIGLLLLVESCQGLGHGRAAWAAFEARARGWPEVRRARIAVLGIDRRAQRFWRHQGFVPTGEALRSWRLGVQLLILSKRLQT